MASDESDNMDSEPRRKSSTILPRPDFNLPNLGDVVPFQAGGALQPSTQRASLPNLFVPGVSTIFIDGNPTKEYNICGKIFTMEQPQDEESTSLDRTTVGQRNLKYVLKVKQEPAKARACGAGPKSSSDRRPVDPPPVVQLNIYDMDTGEDITMVYDATFMLYASLEIGRPIAHGRMHTPTQPPVLTGVAVASTAYLETPMRAGYFIFPDLSIRHEGWYRLKFSLFEAVKHPNDADIGRPFDEIAVNAAPNVIAHQSMDNRMEVQSKPFQVYSAKKFPGLNESTALSKALADQGCRVRIRREIRQRKRVADDKPDDGRSSRTSPAPSYSEPDHGRSDSRSSIGYRDDRMRQNSMEYTRPTPSRQLSIASMTHPSPTVTTPMAPPPTNYSSPMYSPANRDRMMPRQLPPIADLRPPISYENRSAYPHPPHQYALPPKAPVKRSFSPSYEERSSLKSGARPDQRPIFHQPMSSTQHIEPDDNVDDDENEPIHLPSFSAPFYYPKADGQQGEKRGWGYQGRRL